MEQIFLAYAHLLTDLSADELAPVFETIIENTHEYLVQRQYRSTHTNAKLVTLQKHKERSLSGTVVSLDGVKYELDETGSLQLVRNNSLTVLKFLTMRLRHFI